MSYKLLVVDNSTALANPWRKALVEQYSVSEVVGGFEAAARLKNDTYDLIVVNLANKHIKGVDAISKIREKNDKIPIVVLTDPKDPLSLKQAKTYGIQQALPFPVDVNLLFVIISKLVPKVDIEDYFTSMNLPGETKRVDSVHSKKAGTHNFGTITGAKNGKEFTDVETRYYEGLSAIGANQIETAIEIFTSILKITSIKTEKWRLYIEDAYFQLGLCYTRKKEYENSIKYYKEFVTRAPRHKNLKAALLYIGQNYEGLKVYPKAVFYYKKVSEMKPFDSHSTQASKLLKKIEKAGG